MKYYITVALLVFTLTSCSDFTFFGSRHPSHGVEKVYGWKPIFAQDTSYKNVTYVNKAMAVNNPGNIYIYKNYILQSELGKGIHIIDKQTPGNSKRIGFIKIAGNTDLSIKNDILYANNYWDLVMVDISNLQSPVFISRQKNVFNHSGASNFIYDWQKPDSTGYYECNYSYNRDSIIIGWRRDSVYNYCYKK